MRNLRYYGKTEARTDQNPDPRLFILFGAICTVTTLVIARLFVLMILQHAFYAALASGQQEIFRKLFPERGEISVTDRQSGKLMPVAANRMLSMVYADPRLIKDPADVTEKLATIFGIVIPEEKANATSEEVLARQKAIDEKTKILTKVSKKDDPYELLKRQVPDDVVERIKELKIDGIGFADERVRYYPEPMFGGPVLGFVGYDDHGNRIGRYGLEGYFERELAGKAGYEQTAKGAVSAWVDLASRQFVPSEDGAHIVLTIDPAIQNIACKKLREAVEVHRADRGSVVILEPKTGAVLAMCSAPDFDPNIFNQVKDAAVFSNIAISHPYEPGSVMKPVTIAAAIDDGKISPDTTYEDKGSVTLGEFTFRNSDLKAHGIQTMTQVLEKSLNTGVFFAEELMQPDVFKRYVYDFGFGAATGIELDTESKGTLASLDKPGRIYRATASFGQGITSTVLQVADAFVVFANQGKLMKPHVIDRIEYANGRIEKTEPQAIRQVISARTSSLVSGMLVSVVENGHGKKAGVPGYWVAGKTGTAQIPNDKGSGYLTGEGSTIGTFAGFAPVEDPHFVMVTRIDRPKDAVYAETTAAPLFGDIAKFLLQYFEIPPTRTIK